MRQYRLLLIGVVLALVLGLIPVYFGRTQKWTSPFTTGGGEPNGINLNIGENASSITPDQTISLTIIAKNMLTHSSDLPNIARWGADDMSTGVCEMLYPTGIVVYNDQGTVVNIINNFAGYFCPIIVDPFRTSFHFGPLENITKSVSFRGYWTAGRTIVPGGYYEGVFHPFSPGTYTVVVGDIWGHLAVTHFTVIPR